MPKARGLSLVCGSIGAHACAFDSLFIFTQAGCKSGLVFTPSTSLDCLKYVMDKVDIILLMSVNPGFGGQKFIPATLEKAKEARKMIEESVSLEKLREEPNEESL